MLSRDLADPASAIAQRLTERGETIAVAESAAGGLISAALVAVPGASAYYQGGLIIYTVVGARELLTGGPRLPADVRGASEPFARWLALSAAVKLGTHWGIGETGAAGPAGNPYGDPPGHAWVAVRAPDGETHAQQVLTGSSDRAHNMVSFAVAALVLMRDALG